jgi:hypothetical protein
MLPRRDRAYRSCVTDASELPSAWLEDDDDEADTGIYARPDEVDLLLAMVDASEASGSIIIEIDAE